MSPEIAEIYGNKVRIRVMGLCWRGDSLLMVRHEMGDKDLWAPPGGGVEYGETLEDALRREFFEETGLVVSAGKFLFGCEFLQKPLHAIELFFEVTRVSGEVKTGTDPELPIIRNAQFLSPEQIGNIPSGAIHGIFNTVTKPEKLCQLSGFYRI
jgi:8-oxo-dGTP diphosphatase